MATFNRDYALIRTSTGQIYAESHDAVRLEEIRQSYLEKDIFCEVQKSDRPRSHPLGIGGVLR